MILETLQRAKSFGFMPSAILDIGAYEGVFARNSRLLWPDAHILMVDALSEKIDVLKDAAKSIGNCSTRIVLLGEEEEKDDVPFFIARGNSSFGPNQTGSSKYR